MSKRLSRTIAFATSLTLGLALLAGVTFIPRLAHAASFSVTDCTQYGTASTNGTLAKAFADAASASGASTITFGCDTSGGGIVFPAAVSPTKDLTLDATGHNVTLSGNNATQLFSLNTSGITLTLEHLTITEGKSTALGAGGAISSVGTDLTLIDCVFTQNTATGAVGGAGGAIYASGADVLIAGSTFSENSVIATGAGSVGFGGAVAVGGSLEIEASTFSGNSVSSVTAEGGAMYLEGGQSDVTSSTFTGNSVTSTNTTAAPGSALGGAIFLVSPVGTTQIANSTITGNTADSGSSISNGAAGGGIVAYPSNTVPLALINDTIAANILTGSAFLIGSNLANGGATTTITAVNTIISGGQGASNCDAAITDNGHNLDSGSSCGFALADSNQDPLLAALAGNGGPTQTMSLLSGSPAIDAGDDTICGNAPVSGADQRGVTRPQGASCDIGAYELVTPIATTTSLKASATSLTCGQSVTLTATVSAGRSSTSTGAVTFKDGAKALGMATLSGGTATFSTTTLDNGTHTITAVYNGTSPTGTTPFLSSTSTAVTVTVAGCQGLGGLGPAPQAPQGPKAPQPIPAGGANSPATSNGPATGLIPDPSAIQAKWTALAPKGHPTTAATSPSFPLQVILLLAGLLLAGIGATGLVVTRRRAV